MSRCPALDWILYFPEMNISSSSCIGEEEWGLLGSDDEAGTELGVGAGLVTCLRGSSTLLVLMPFTGSWGVALLARPTQGLAVGAPQGVQVGDLEEARAPPGPHWRVGCGGAPWCTSAVAGAVAPARVQRGSGYRARTLPRSHRPAPTPPTLQCTLLSRR